MTNKAIFLDRDGTINVDKNHTYKIENLEIISGVVEGLKRLQEEYPLIVITNQSGIARGLYTKEDYFVFRNEMHKRLKNQGIFITAEYFCPHNQGENCNCRKPQTGMLEEAAKNFNLNLKECWIIGDRLCDIQAGKNAGCRTIHVLTGPIANPLKEADFVAEDMIKSVDYILDFEHNNK
jgi:histidinol-phosphate phosphatase family protein